MGNAMKKSERCRCALCKYVGASVFREYMLQTFPELAARADAEDKLAKRWHAYAPQQRQLAARLPERAVALAYAARQTPALKQLRDWHDAIEDLDEDKIAVLSGPQGTGKTVAAVYLALHRLADHDPRFITAAELARVPRHGELRDELLESVCLLVDDLGTERADDKFLADFDELFDRVYQANAGMLVITTNLTARQFEQRYGARVVDRFAEVGTWIPIVGKSMRAKAAKERT